MATDIFSVMEGLTVERDEILEAETFTQKYLESLFPTYDFRQGTAVRDMVIRPNAVMIALIQKALKYYHDESDVINMTNDTDKDLVDRKMSNFFITRRAGNKSVINARLFFSFPTVEPISTQIPLTAYFSTDDDAKFFPTSNITVLPPVQNPVPGQYYFEYDSEQSLWFVDIEMASEGKDEKYNIEEGDLLYFTIFSPYFMQGEIQYLVTKSLPEETNTEMVERAYDSVSTRNLVNDPSIISRLRDEFNYVNDVFPIGLGSPHLYRDLIRIEEIEDPADPWPVDYVPKIFEYHRGGHTDVIIASEPRVFNTQLAINAQNEIFVEGPVVDIVRAPYNPLETEVDTIPLDAEFTVEAYNSTTYDANSVPADPTKDYGLSTRQITKITFTNLSSYEGATASFDIKSFTGLNAVQQFVDDPANRVVSSDILIRSYEPIFIDIDIQTHGEAPTDPEKLTELRDAAKAYINEIPRGGTLYVSDVVQSFTDAGLSDFVMPITVNAERIDRNLDSHTTVVTDTHDSIDTRKFMLRDLVIRNKA